MVVAGPGHVSEAKRELLNALLGGKARFDFAHPCQDVKEDPADGQALDPTKPLQRLDAVWRTAKRFNTCAQRLGPAGANDSLADSEQEHAIRVPARHRPLRRRPPAAVGSATSGRAGGGGGAAAGREVLEVPDFVNPQRSSQIARVQRHVHVVDELCCELAEFPHPEPGSGVPEAVAVLCGAAARRHEVPAHKPATARAERDKQGKTVEAEASVYLGSLAGLSHEELAVDELIWEVIAAYTVRFHAWCRRHMEAVVVERQSAAQCLAEAEHTAAGHGASEDVRRRIRHAVEEVVGEKRGSLTIQRIIRSLKRTLNAENRNLRYSKSSGLGEEASSMVHVFYESKDERKVLNAFSSAGIDLESAEAVPVDPNSSLAHEQQIMYAKENLYLQDLYTWEEGPPLSADDLKSRFKMK